MERVVVTFSTGGDLMNDPVEHILCFEYESAEAWLVEFEEALVAAIGRLVHARKQWHKYYATPSGKRRDSLPPEDDGEKFAFAGHRFETRHHIERWPTAGDPARNLPEVLTLNEWFAAKIGETADPPE